MQEVTELLVLGGKLELIEMRSLEMQEPQEVRENQEVPERMVMMGN
jgi:hypothetical protein